MRRISFKDTLIPEDYDFSDVVRVIISFPSLIFISYNCLCVFFEIGIWWLFLRKTCHMKNPSDLNQNLLSDFLNVVNTDSFLLSKDGASRIIVRHRV